MSRSIDEIIEAQGWNKDSVNDLLFRYIENQGSMDALNDFLERAAEEENEPEESGPTLFKATIEVLVRASSEDEAKDAISTALSENILRDRKSLWLDWQYATTHNGEFQREPGPKAIATEDACSEFPEFFPGETCEECGKFIPGKNGGSIANKHHAESCSLYDSDSE